MSLQAIFTNYWDQAITGFIGGLVVYILTLKDGKIFGISLKNKITRSIYAFIVALILVSVYSLLVYFTE